MKAVLMSIRPQHLVNILNGYKTLELRKTIPKDFKGWVYCYCTKSKPYYEPRINGITKQKMWNIHNDFIYHTDLNGKVVARFWFDDCIKLDYEDTYSDEFYWRNSIISGKELEKATCLSQYDIVDYGKNKPLYAWHIKNLEIFDKPKELSEFNYYPLIGNNMGVNCKYRPLTKAPKSWCYVEEFK